MPRCPICSTPVDQKSRKCPICGKVLKEADLAGLAALDDLAAEVVRLQTVRDNFDSALTQVSNRLIAVKKLFESDLRQRLSSAETQAARPEAVQDSPGLAVDSPPPLPDESVIKTMNLEPSQRVEPSPGPVRPVSPEPSPRVQESPGLHETRPEPEAVPEAAGTQETQEGLEFRLGQKWLLIIGIVVMFFGVGYFLKYSFERGWIAPSVRVAMAYAWGAAFLAAGEYARRRDYARFGLYLMGGGVAVLYFASYAGFSIYGLFNQPTSFLIMALTTALTIFLAVRLDSIPLAALGLLGGFLTPVLLSSGQDRMIPLLTYLALLNGGVLAAAFYKRWNILNRLGFVATYIIYTGWWFSHYEPESFWPALLFLNLFFLIYALIPYVYDMTSQDRPGLGNISIIILNSLIAFAYGHAMIDKSFAVEWSAALSGFYALVFAGLAFDLARRSKRDTASFALLTANAVFFLALAGPLLLSENWITLFWALQAACVLWLGFRLEKKSLAVIAYLIMSAALMKLFFYDYSEIFNLRHNPTRIQPEYLELLWARWATLAAVLGSLAAMTRISSTGKPTPGYPQAGLARALFLFVLFLVLNLEGPAFLHDYHFKAARAVYAPLWIGYAALLLNLAVKRDIAWLAGMAQFPLFAGIINFLTFGYPEVFWLSDYPYRFIPSYANLIAERYLCAAVILAVLLYFAGRFKTRDILGQSADSGRACGVGLYCAVFTLVLFYILNIECSAFFFEYLPAARITAISVLWGAYSIALMLFGFRKNIRAFRMAALALFAVTLGKVLLVDMSEFETPYRIASFIILGLLLVGASFLYHRYKDAILLSLAEKGALEAEKEDHP